MLRSLLCLVVSLCLSLNLVADEKADNPEKGDKNKTSDTPKKDDKGNASDVPQKDGFKKPEPTKEPGTKEPDKSVKSATPEAPQKDTAKKGETAKESSSKDPEVPAWVPKQFLGTHVAKRLAKLQAEIDEATAKRGPAREEAEKARKIAREAEHKVDVLTGTIKALESEKTRTMENGNKQLREFALDKADNENSQKINKLEAQVRDLAARLEAANKQQATKQSSEKQSQKK